MSDESRLDGYGEPDLPITSESQEKFGLTSYIDALADFISNCDTPMTIAIQGTWGTGKTSLMNLVKTKLKDKVVYLEFNTWQYSQFNMSDNLAKSFLFNINKKLAEATVINPKTKDENGNPIIKESDLNKEIKKSRNSFNKNLVPLFGWVTKALTDEVAGSTAAKKYEQVFNGISQAFNLVESDEAATAISNLKAMFKSHVDKCLKEIKGKTSEKKNRVVIFIDDLDRLPPKNAVELLEVIKLFLDCENCVFVLAVDYSVVATGIEEKYKGIDNDVDKDKGKMFFDKIIQLPFKMPVTQYNIDAFVTDLFQPIINNYCEDSDLQEIIEIIEKTIGKNPRSIKRLFNSFSLTLKVAEKRTSIHSKDVASDNKNIFNKDSFNFFFCLHCIQLSQEEIYNYILSNILHYEQFSKDKKNTILENVKKSMAKNKVSEVYQEKMENVLELFIKFLTTLVTSLEKDFDNKNPNSSYDDAKKFYITYELTKLTYLTSLTSTLSNNEISNYFGDTGFLFKGKVYDKQQTNNNNISWLGRDILEEIITKKFKEMEDVLKFSKALMEFKKEENHDHYQKFIIQSNKHDTNTHEKAIQIGSDEVFVIKNWGQSDILDLFKFVKKEWPGEDILDIKGQYLLTHME